MVANISAEISKAKANRSALCSAVCVRRWLIWVCDWGMGTYLSTPIVTKAIESGEAQDCSVTPLAWGVVDMQGWRKTMEDAHVAQTDVDAPPHVYMDDESRQKGSDAKVFGVFDGHGGPEVARFCQLYMVDVLTKQPAWVEESPEKEDPNDPSSSAVGQALVTAFHSLDRMIDDKTRRYVVAGVCSSVAMTCVCLIR